MADELWRSLLVQTVLTLLAALGALQIAALHNGLEGLAWPVGLRHRRSGYLLAGLFLTLGLLGGVFLTKVETITGPRLSAAAFLAGCGSALVIQIVGAALRLSWNRRRTQPLPSKGKPITLGPIQATLYQPVDRWPSPALCLLPDPTAPGDDLEMLAQGLMENGIAVLVLDWRSLDNPDRLTLQGLVAMGISHLTRWPGTDTQRVALVGVGLGGDLALRCAAADVGVTVTLALEPVLTAQRPGLGLSALRCLSWFEAHRRAHAWQRSPLVKELDALTAIRSITGRPIAIVTGLDGDAQVVDNLEILRAGEDCPLAVAAQTEKVNCAVAWLKERFA